jgi:magnesium transporter
VDGKVEVTNRAGDDCWVNVLAPTAEEIARIQQDFNIPPEVVQYCLDVDEMPRTDKEDGITLIVIRVPLFQGEGHDVPYTTLPLGIVFTERFIMTVCREDTNVLRDFVAGKMRGFSPAKKYRFILQLLWSMANDFLSRLREINRTVERVEDRLQASLRNKEVLELLKYQKSLVYFMTALKSNELVMERLHRSQIFQLYSEDAELLDDVLIEIRQAIEMTDIASNILSQMMDAFASIISNNLNVVMKFLASITIILTLPTMVASFYGMNVRLPLQDEPLSFWMTLGISILLSLVVGYTFWKKDWL